MSLESRAPMKSVFPIPLSIQRYQWVQEFISRNPNIRSVTDFGCGNGRIMIWLKTIQNLEQINFVDKDDALLELELHNYFRPGLCDMIHGRQNSNIRLDIKVYNGNLAHADERLIADCFLMVEVIEHMLPEHVEQAARTLFGHYQPQIILITTPNREFNHLLRQDGESPDKFRHSDHKFEWTRAQFVLWSHEICQRYPYSVEFDGVGHLPGSEPYGPCTQIGIFRRLPGYQTMDELDPFCSALLKLNVEEESVRDGNYWIESTDGDQKKAKLMAEFTLPGQATKLNSSIESHENYTWT